MPTKHIPTIVGAGVTMGVADAVLGRRKAKPRKAKCKCPSCKPKKAGKAKKKR
jgi:hypothetical protein